jgi:hypothetical protein
LCGHASALSGRTELELAQNFMAGDYVKITARGHGQHQCFVMPAAFVAQIYFVLNLSNILKISILGNF